MTVPDADERATRAWSGTASGSSPGRRYVANQPVVPGADRGVEETLDVAGLKQRGHQPDLEFVVKRDSTVLSISHPVLGDPKHGEVGRSILGFFSPDHTTDIISKFEKLFAGSEQESFVCRGNPPLAAEAWYHCRVIPNFGESGLDSATVFVRDITDCKRDEDDFRAEFSAEIDTLRSQIAQLSSEKDKLTDLLAERERREEELIRFHTVIDQAGEAIFITDPDTGQFVDVNDTACRWLGHSREELLQMGVGDLHVEFPLESPDGDAHHVAETRDSTRPEAYLSGSHRRRDGTSFPVEVTLSRRRFGDRDLLLVIARDAKQRRRAAQAEVDSENDRRSLFELSRDAIYCSARDGTVSEVNDSAIDLFGYSRGEFLGLEARKLFHDPDHIRAFQQAVDEGGSVKDLPVVFLTRTGQPFEGVFGATLRYDHEGNVLGYQCVISPIGESASPVSRRSEAGAASDWDSTDVAGDGLESAVRSAAIIALEEEVARAKRELEEVRSESAAARADAEWAKSELEHAKSEAGKAKQAAELASSELTEAKSEAQEAKARADAQARELDDAQREVERAESETAKAKADAERAVAELERASSDVEESNKRVDAERKRAERARNEAEDAKAEVATARADAERFQREVEDAKAEVVNAKANAERAERELQKIKSEAAAANRNAEQAMLDAVGAKMEARKARSRFEARAREAQRAKRETEKARKEVQQTKAELEQTKCELEHAKADAEKARQAAEQAASELAKAKSDAEEAKARAESLVQQLRNAQSELERAKAEVESAAERVEPTNTDSVAGPSSLEQVILEAEKAWAEAERSERAGEIVVPASDAVESKPKELPSGSNTLTYLESLVAADRLPPPSSEAVDVTPVFKRHRKRNSPPKRGRWITPRGWMWFAAVVAAGSVTGWLAMSSIGNHNTNSFATVGEVNSTSQQTGQNTGETPVLMVPDSEVSADSSGEPSTESVTDSVTGQVATTGPRESDSRARD